MNSLNKIAQDIATSHAGGSPAIMAQAFAEMILKGIDRALNACREGILSMVENKMQISIETIDTLDMDFIIGQGLIETGYMPDSRMCDCSDKTVAREIALMVAQEYFKNSPQAMINGMGEMVEKGINQALEQVKIGLKKMSNYPYFPKDPRQWNVSQAVATAQSEVGEAQKQG